MTKADMVAGIVNVSDQLDFSGLLAREDVQTAIKKSEAINFNAYQKAGEIGGSVFNANIRINDQAEKIMEEIVIFGLTDVVRVMVKSFKSFIDTELSAIK
jgi:hypothetical protein